MAVNKNKILIVLPKLNCGGTERTAAELANYIAENGGEVSILLMFREEIFFTLHKNVKLIQPKNIRKKIGRILYLPYLLFFLRRSIKAENAEMIFSLGYIAITLAVSLGLSSTVIISGRSSPTRIRFPGNRILNNLYIFSHRILKKRVNGIIAQTTFAKEIYSKKYRIPIKVIPNFLREIKPHDHLTRNNQIVTVGRLTFEKGQHFLLQAFSKLQAPGWKLVLVGEGPKRSELEKLAVDLGIGGSVIFKGLQKDVDYFLSQSKIFVFTSIIEGFPNALIEAMANPLACVSFNCEAGPSDIIQNAENGFLVEVGDIDELVKKIQLLVDDEKQRSFVTNNALLSRKRYSINKIAGEYLNFFSQVAQHK